MNPNFHYIVYVILYFLEMVIKEIWGFEATFKAASKWILLKSICLHITYKKSCLIP